MHAVSWIHGFHGFRGFDDSVHESDNFGEFSPFSLLHAFLDISQVNTLLTLSLIVVGQNLYFASYRLKITSYHQKANCLG